MYKHHSSFKEPDNPNIKIWRCLKLKHLISLLKDNTLFFPSIVYLGDSLEGCLNQATVDHLRSSKKLLQSMEELRKLFYVSCWRMDEHESPEMWEKYLRDGKEVAIQSTYNRLKKSFSKTNEDIWIGTVRYTDEKIDWLNEFNLVICKAENLRRENELRVVFDWKQPTTDTMSTKIIKKLDNGEKVQIKDILNYKIQINPIKGYTAQINLDELVERIYIAPNLKERRYANIEKVVKMYKPQVEVIRSELSK